MDFCHLHNHSYYSLMDGLNSPLELLQAAKDLGQTAMAVTDHGTLSAHRDFQRSAKELGIKPILGLEAYISPTDRFDKRSVKAREDNTQLYNHIILLAKDQAGLANLQHLSETAWNEGYYFKPRIDKDLLSEYGDGLIVLSGCMGGLISKAIERGEFEEADNLTRWFAERFEGDFYMELQEHNPLDLNVNLIRLAEKYGVKTTITADCHFARENDRWVEEAMLILSTSPKRNFGANFEHSRTLDRMERFNYLYPDRPISFENLDLFVADRGHLEDKMKDHGLWNAEMFDSTLEIADKIGDYDYAENLSLLPMPKSDPEARLKAMCRAGMKERDLNGRPEYEDRLEEEIAVIVKKDFVSYFLVVAEMVSWAKNNDILVGPGRGSAAGSLVCYTLGITEVDPIKYDLLFGRFINEERNDFPDIDTDFPDRSRKAIKAYLTKKFKNVASISTFARFSDKTVVRDAARVYNVPLKDVNKALKTVDTFEEFENSPNTWDFRNKYPEVTELARRLRGRIRSVGMHAGGIVVANQPISNFAPMESRRPANAEEGEERLPVVAYDMEEVANIGLIKIDALGLKTLSVVSDALDKIKERNGRSIDMRKVGLDDPKVYRDLSNGFTRGVFQAEATPYTKLLIEMGVDNFEDLAASNALVRPGAKNTVGADFIARKEGRQQVSYIHPIMEQYTKNTYGLIIYQEQVMQACVYLAGMTWAEADKIRKIIGKKQDVTEFDKWKAHFIEGASKNITEEAAETLWHQFEAHAGYSFNRSHAIAYSMLTYWTAWLKHYYPVEYMWALLKNEKDKAAITNYLIECKRLKLKMQLPHVNISESNFSIQDDKITFGLSSIKYLSEKTAPRLIRARPFKSYKDVLDLMETKGSGVTTRIVGALNAVGAAAFDDNPRSPDVKSNLYEYLNIPEFDLSVVPAKVLARLDTCDDFEEAGVYTLMVMVKSIKRGEGWSRVEVVDSTGGVGIFHNENTVIETGKMYLMLVGDNRIHRYIDISDIEELYNDGDPFLRWLIDKPEFAIGYYYVVDWTNYKTKTNKWMAHVIIANSDGEPKRIMVFNKNYARGLALMKPGNVLTLNLGRMEDDTLFVRKFDG